RPWRGIARSPRAARRSGASRASCVPSQAESALPKGVAASGREAWFRASPCDWFLKSRLAAKWRLGAPLASRRMRTLTAIDDREIRDLLARDEFFWLDLTAPSPEDVEKLEGLLSLHPRCTQGLR